MLKFFTLRGLSLGFTEGTEGPRPARVARYSRRGGTPSLSISESALRDLIHESYPNCAGLLVKSRQSDIYRGCEAVSWSGGRCSFTPDKILRRQTLAKLNPLSILQRLRRLRRIYCVCSIRCPRLVYSCRFSYDFVRGTPTHLASVCFWLVVEDRAATSRLRSLSLVVAPSGHLLIIRWWWWLQDRRWW